MTNDKLTWLLDEKQEESGASDLKPAIESIGDHHITISRQEARHGSPQQTIPLHLCPTLAYGSVEFNKAVRADFYPGKWCDWTELRCDHHYASIGKFLINDDYIFLPSGEVMRRLPDLLKEWEQVFLRPSRADKPFSGFVANADTGEDIKLRLRNMTPSDLVVLASAKAIEAEYRLVAVRAGKIVASSQYLQHGQFFSAPQTPPEALAVAETIVLALGKDFPDPMLVIDIGKCEGRYGLVEINGFSFANFYACDLEAIVRVAHEQAMMEWQEMKQ